ncbi:MAG: 30S ribosomal protein S6 [Planctomycetes bacterium]|nr:30S ribosomal protein S6 [Planctomycetota bacterium]
MHGTYEGMFVLEPTIAGKDWNKVVETVHGLATKHGAEILASNKWGDRKLAYEIRGHKRGAYLLVYFKSETPALTAIAREAELSDIVLRSVIVRVEAVPPPEEQVAPTPATTERK